MQSCGLCPLMVSHRSLVLFKELSLFAGGVSERLVNG